MSEDFSFQSKQVAIWSLVIALMAAALVGSGQGWLSPA